jgi:hypothetical protein
MTLVLFPSYFLGNITLISFVRFFFCLPFLFSLSAFLPHPLQSGFLPLFTLVRVSVRRRKAPLTVSLPSMLFFYSILDYSPQKHPQRKKLDAVGLERRGEGRGGAVLILARLDESNTINIKLFPLYPPPPPVKAWQVPLSTVRLESLMDENWDLTMQRVSRLFLLTIFSVFRSFLPSARIRILHPLPFL